MDTSLLESCMDVTRIEHPVTKDNNTATSSLSLDETVKQMITTASSFTATKPQYQASKPRIDLSYFT